jgi:hypothetical protein
MVCGCSELRIFGTSDVRDSGFFSFHPNPLSVVAPLSLVDYKVVAQAGIFIRHNSACYPS